MSELKSYKECTTLSYCSKKVWDCKEGICMCGSQEYCDKQKLVIDESERDRIFVVLPDEININGVIYVKKQN